MKDLTGYVLWQELAEVAMIPPERAYKLTSLEKSQFGRHLAVKKEFVDPYLQLLSDSCLDLEGMVPWNDFKIEEGLSKKEARVVKEDSDIYLEHFGAAAVKFPEQIHEFLKQKGPSVYSLVKKDESEEFDEVYEVTADFFLCAY